jgi:hypothetical protein
MTVPELQQIVETEGLQAVSDRLGVNKSTVCHVVRGTYRGKPDRILQAAEAVYSQRPVECPVLGDITLCHCIEEKNRPFSAVNPIRVSLARTCPKCAAGAGKEKHDGT